MHRFMKLLVCAAVAAMLQLAAFAAVSGTSSHVSSASSHVSSASSHVSSASSHVSSASSHVSSASSQVSSASSHVSGASSHVSGASSHVSSHVSGTSGASMLNREGEATLYRNEIPHTGTESLAIPGIVAMLAAATAAITLTGKKK